MVRGKGETARGHLLQQRVERSLCQGEHASERRRLGLLGERVQLVDLGLEPLGVRAEIVPAATVGTQPPAQQRVCLLGLGLGLGLGLRLGLAGCAPVKARTRSWNR